MLVFTAIGKHERKHTHYVQHVANWERVRVDLFESKFPMHVFCLQRREGEAQVVRICTVLRDLGERDSTARHGPAPTCNSPGVARNSPAIHRIMSANVRGVLYTALCVHIYIYIYMERERGRERERWI